MEISLLNFEHFIWRQEVVQMQEGRGAHLQLLEYNGLWERWEHSQYLLALNPAVDARFNMKHLEAVAQNLIEDFNASANSRLQFLAKQHLPAHIEGLKTARLRFEADIKTRKATVATWEQRLFTLIPSIVLPGSQRLA